MKSQKKRERTCASGRKNCTTCEAKSQALFSCQVAQKCFRKFVQFVDGAKVVSEGSFWYTLIKKRERGTRQ